MILVICRCEPRPGQEAESRAAVDELTASVQTHAGLVEYFWNTDESSSDLHVVEMFEDEASVFKHIEQSDLSRFLAATVFREIKVYGGAPSAKLRETLSSVCDLVVYPACEQPTPVDPSGTPFERNVGA